MIVVKVIPDKIFHILWNNAKKFELLDDYIKYFTSIKSRGYIDFYKECNINEIDIFVTLSNIYKAANLSFKEIVELAGVKKIEISNIFCIPIRTIEDWYAGKSKCNDYIRLMFIRHFELLDLGRHVQNEYKYIKKYKGQIANNVDINSGKVGNSKKIEKNIIRKNKRNEKNIKISLKNKKNNVKKKRRGRFMLAPFGHLISTVLHKKHIYKEYVGLDACAANLMRPAMYGSYHHITVLGKEDALLDHVYDVTGGLCENNDKFAIDRSLPAIKIGDIVCIHDTGAHGFSMGYNYNGKLRSAEVLLHPDGSFTKIRRAETPADYFATFDETPFKFGK